MLYENYFTDEKIIEVICSLRINEAFKNHQKYFFIELEHLKEYKNLIYSYTPPRRIWVNPDKQHRGRLGATQLNLWSLQKTINKYKSSTDLWNINLKNLIKEIQTKAFDTIAIDKPKISFLPKDNIYWRPLTLFSLQDHIYICLLSKYLTDLKDEQFQDCCIAFRSKKFQKKTGIKTYHQIIQKLIDYRKQHNNIYVAECDIKAFYDTVPHQIILDKINNDNDLDIRAKKAITNYLNSYQFYDVLKESELRKKPVKWPNKDIKEQYKMGLPQGGAISCWLSNYYLDSTDEKLVNSLTNRDIYYRYCDDIILLSTNKKRINKIFNLYMKDIKEKGLFYHPPLSAPYGKEWYDVKSKSPYNWSKEYPYISFLGYQIKYDGIIQIRKKSIEKEKQHQRDFIDKAIEVFYSAKEKPNTKKYIVKIKAKLFKRILGLSYRDFSKKKTFAWSTGFKILNKNDFNTTQIKELDRNLKREIDRLKKVLRIKKIKNKYHQFEYMGSYYSGFKKSEI